jgi:hypothetical protein
MKASHESYHHGHSAAKKGRKFFVHCFDHISHTCKQFEIGV